MSSADRNNSTKKKNADFFELTVYTLAAVVVAMLVAHWIGIY